MGLNYPERKDLFFFKKKICAACGEKMARQKKVESLGEGLDSVKLGQLFVGDRHEITLFYYCKKCDKLYSIGELSGEKNKLLYGGCQYDDRLSFRQK